MTPKDLIDALKSGHDAAAIIDAWLRAGDALVTGRIALGFALVALLIAVFALARTYQKPH